MDINDIIIDHKIFAKAKKQNDIDTDLQLTAYALGYRVSTGTIEQGLRIDSIIKNKVCKIVQISTTRTNKDCRWFMKLIGQMVTTILDGNFHPNPTGWHCNKKYCGYWGMCKR
ncbi:RecB family exonuclease [Candidatus Magnetobacterium bavaricum]|uniref:RecB family exonuclease n=1 Tax=Candidatus Magnetobacterium bavaricum TaxID=29290 RepID=A0A0F3GZ96_9BACT|nr:RecB family exonuclease [Candidatus Magnetobacterium bavaricum]